MYAVIMTGGKQYRVSQGDKVRVEKLDAAEGDSIELDKVLMDVDGDDVKIGAPVHFEPVQLHKSAGIQKCIQPFTRSEFAAFMLFFNTIGTATFHRL